MRILKGDKAEPGIFVDQRAEFDTELKKRLK
jgi:hypothetical protein